MQATTIILYMMEEHKTISGPVQDVARALEFGSALVSRSSPGQELKMASLEDDHGRGWFLATAKRAKALSLSLSPPFGYVSDRCAFKQHPATSCRRGPHESPALV